MEVTKLSNRTVLLWKYKLEECVRNASGFVVLKPADI